MPKQPAFPGLRDAMQKKQTRRELFLSESEAQAPLVRAQRRRSGKDVDHRAIVAPSVRVTMARAHVE